MDMFLATAVIIQCSWVVCNMMDIVPLVAVSDDDGGGGGAEFILVIVQGKRSEM